MVYKDLYFRDPRGLASSPRNCLCRPRGLAAGYLAVVALFQLADGPEVIASGVLGGHRDTDRPTHIVLAGYWGLCPPLAVLPAFGLGLDGLGVWLALAGSMAIVSALLVRRVARSAAAP